MPTITLTPAYGRDYHSPAAAIRDLQSGKDFILEDISSPWDGRPCSIRNFPDGTEFTLYFNHLRRVCTFTKGAQS